MEHEDYICPVCYQYYNDSERAPRMVPVCGHTICTKCIAELLGKMDEGADTFICPEDRAEFPVISKDINLFPKNYALLKLNEKRQRAAIDAGEREQVEPLPTSRKHLCTTDEESNKSSSLSEVQTVGNSDCDEVLIEQETPTSSDNLLEDPQTSTVANTANAFESAVCLEHNRRLELVCLDHKCRICANCALFGSHKNHDFRTEEEVLKEVAGRAECLIDLFQIIDTNQGRMLDQSFIDSLNSKLRSKYEELSKEVHDKFNSFINQIRATERKVLEQVSQKISDIEESFKELCSLPPQLNEKINRWKNSAQIKLTSLSEKTENGEIAFELLEDRYDLKGDILANGEKVVAELEKANETPVKSLEEVLVGLSLSFSTTFSTELSNLCMINEAALARSKWRNDLVLDDSPKQLASHLPSERSFDRFKLENICTNINPAADFNINAAGAVMPGSNSALLGASSPTYGYNNSFPKNNRFAHFTDDTNLLNFESNSFNLVDFPDHLNDSKRESMQFPSGFLKCNDGTPFNNLACQQQTQQYSSQQSFSNSSDNNALKCEGVSFPYSNLGDITNLPQNNLMYNQDIPMTYRKAANCDESSENSAASMFSSSMAPQYAMTGDHFGMGNEKNKQSIQPKIGSNTSSTQNANLVVDQEELNKGKSSLVSQTPARANGQMTKRKTSNLKVNIKFEPLIEGLKSASMENVDLTGCELGDFGLTVISDYLIGNKKLKSLKLLRNKITDEGALILAKALADNTSLATLNLTQNLLTEKTLDAFLNLFKTNSTIKTIYFNQNSIKIMNVKSKIKEIQKLGINISI